MTAPRRVIVTCAPPNPNGDLHVGHLSGPFLGGDVQHRYLRQQGHDVTYVGYADDYSCYVERRGAELGHTAAETAHVFGQRIEETLGLASMLPDYFTHPLREGLHAEVVQRFFLELWERDAFDVVELPVYWCQDCDRYLYEAEMRGRCQFCDAASDGFYCEECGQPQDSAGLVDPRCTRCGGEPARRALPRIVFPLDRYRERLREHYEGRPMRPRLRAYLDDMLSRPLPATAVSREAPYGIPVPLTDWRGHILDTWYSGIWGYVAGTAAYFTALGDRDAGIRAWSDPDSEVIHFIGFDCSFSHALLWPALFLAHGDLHLPDHVVTNEFYRLEGDKFSTSRGHAIWGGEYLRRVPADTLRFYLCLTGPECEQTSFSAKDFASTVDDLLADALQDWADTLLECVDRDFGTAVPPGEPGGPPALAGWLDRLPVEVAAALEPGAFSPQQAASCLRDVVRAVAADLPSLREARSGDPASYASRLVLHLELLACFAAVSAPIMPSFAEHVWGALRLPYADDLRKVVPWPIPGTRLLSGGQPVAAAVPLLFRAVEGSRR